MASGKIKTEIAPDSRIERPASLNTLRKAQSLLESFGTLKDSVPLTVSDSPLADDLPEAWDSDRIVGTHWSARDGMVTNYDKLEVLVFNHDVQEELGRILAETRKQTNHKRIHGMLNFHQKMTDADFGGTIIFFGDGEEVNEIEVLSEFIHGNGSLSDFEMLEGAKQIGLGLMVETQYDAPPSVEHRVVAMHRLSRDIVGGLESLHEIATPGEA